MNLGGAALYDAVELETNVHAAQPRLDGDVVGIHVLALELVAVTAGPLEVDLAGQLGQFGEKDDVVLSHVDEAAVHGRRLSLAVSLADANDRVVEGSEERGVVGEEGDVAPADGAADHHLRIPAEENELR